ncbi:MAG: imelysin family protein [Pseudomonadota bacterium]
MNFPTKLRWSLALLACAAFSGCKIQVSATAGGSVTTLSGSYTCQSGTQCAEVEVSDTDFDETFVAQPEQGFRFVEWRRRDRGLCGGSQDDCRLFTAGFAGNDTLLAFLSGDEVFFLEAVFEATTPQVSGDDARRVVLADIGEKIILPALRDFEQRALVLQAAASALSDAPADSARLETAQEEWRLAMASWQRNEVLQVGPSGRSANPDAVAGGQDFRDLIYSWPFTLNACSLEAAAANGDSVNAGTPINITGLGAVEQLLFTSSAPADCSAQPTAAQRASHTARLVDRLVILATALRERWEPAEDNFLGQWSSAGLDSSVVYSRPQDALDALSIALFYVEKSTKDRKIALPTGIPVSGFECADPVACPEFLESPISMNSGANLAANVQAFRDVFTGVDGGFGVNALLIAIERQDLADALIEALDVVLADIAAIEAGIGFDAQVGAIADATECINAAANSTGLPPCALQGSIKAAMDIFRAPIVAALGLAIPSAAAGDND